jgi:hypothetical protein
VASRHLTDGFAITIESNGRRLLEALRGRRNRIRLLDELAKVELEDVGLGEAVDRVIADPRRDTHIVIVTPHVDEESARRIRLLLDRGTSALVALVVGEDFDKESFHRASTLGCNVVEIRPGAPLEAVFQRLIGAGGRR